MGVTVAGVVGFVVDLLCHSQSLGHAVMLIRDLAIHWMDCSCIFWVWRDDDIILL